MYDVCVVVDSDFGVHVLFALVVVVAVDCGFDVGAADHVDIDVEFGAYVDVDADLLLTLNIMLVMLML